MAYRLVLPTPYYGIEHIWNISDLVGDQPGCRNAPTDVDLVALLFGGSIRSQDLGAKLHPSVQQAFLINGKMDVNIAYWIRI